MKTHNGSKKHKAINKARTERKIAFTKRNNK